MESSRFDDVDYEYQFGFPVNEFDEVQDTVVKIFHFCHLERYLQALLSYRGLHLVIKMLKSWLRVDK